ncbi:MAG: hypothetical protein APR54_00020 [Candidatus Cloacimonas sp. SDB]|nr:MAG: hypothetical protein APR54_00020 [Candidatus Cloacimonas sp. SDB]
MKYKYLIIMALILSISILNSEIRYTGNTHEYLLEQAYELLKLDMGHEFPEMDDYLNFMKTGVINEDKWDWAYHYSESNPPDFNQFLLPEIIVEIGFLFTEGEEAFVTITHFWGADSGPNNNTLLSGNYPVNYSFNCENALQKVDKFMTGSFTPDYHYSDNDFVEYDDIATGLYIIKVYDLFDLYDTGLCRVFNSLGQSIGYFHLTEINRKALFYEVIGRICHLIMDMSVPAHAHQDQHAPKPNNSDGDQYEGSTEDGFGYMCDPDFWYWDGNNTYIHKGGLLDISNESDPLLHLMYLTNQVADFFASDDVDGDSDLWYDAEVQNANTILNALYLDLIQQGYTLDHPTRQEHEMTYNEAAQIRDVVFPFAMRAVATFLEFIAQEINLTENWIQREVHGHVSLNNGSGDITAVEIKFSGPDILYVNPDENGDFSYTFNGVQLGSYDISYKLYSDECDYCKSSKDIGHNL